MSDFTMEKISVIVPVYNAEKYLDRCIKSIVNQTYQNLEIILVDDESPDNCPQICDLWAEKDERIKVIHKKNEGVDVARKTGLNASTGEYIAFVDSDDWVDLDMYEYLHGLLTSGDYQVSACSYNLAEGESCEISEEPEHIVDLDFSGITKNLYEYSLWSVCFKLYKKELFEKLDMPKLSLSVSEDLLFNYFLFKNTSKMIVSNKKKYYYFRHSDSVMAKPVDKKRIKDQLTAYQMIYDDFDKDSEAFVYQVANKLSNDFLLINQLIIQNGDKECYKLVRQDFLKHWKYVFKAENTYCFKARHKIGTILLLICPALYNLMIKVRG